MGVMNTVAWYGAVIVFVALVVCIVGFILLALAYFFLGVVRSLFPSKNPNCRKDR